MTTTMGLAVNMIIRIIISVPVTLTEPILPTPKQSGSTQLKAAKAPYEGLSDEMPKNFLPFAVSLCHKGAL